MKKMKKSLHYLFFATITFLMLAINLNGFAQSKKIRGKIIDATTQEPLIGANAVIDGLFIGGASDVNGEFEILGTPKGSFKLIVKYIGYEDTFVEFDGIPNEPILIQLKSSSILNEEVIVTAMARGQMGAINKQINSIQIKSVVSSAKMDEIPDATAAESLGRLPGVQISRSGGEANKVSVRGLAPKHNTISVEGVTLLSTDSDNRSVDLSMIAPNILSGLEVTKALTSDMIASSLGGAVNMTLKTAQEGFHTDLSGETGYNDNAKGISDYKFSATLGNRFFNNDLGIMIGAYIERRYRGKDVIDADWAEDMRLTEELRDSTLMLNKITYQDIEDNRSRLGGSIVIDYKLPFGELKLVNFGSRMNQETFTYSQDYTIDQPRCGYSIEKSGDDYQTQMVNKFGADLDLFTGKLSINLSHALAENDNPDRKRIWSWGDYDHLTANDKDSLLATPGFDFNEWINLAHPFGTALGYGFDPAAANPVFISEYGMDREYTTSFDYELPFNIGTKASGSLKFGYMYKYHSRKYDYERNDINVADGTYNLDVSLREYFDIYNNIPENQGNIDMEESWGTDFSNDMFYNGKYNLYPFMGLKHMDEYMTYSKDYYESNDYKIPSNIASFEKDQDGTEKYNAAYIMTEIKLLKERVRIIPGVRYEKIDYKYSTYSIIQPRGAVKDLTTYVTAVESPTITHKNFFPSIQAIIKPTEWMDARLAYNQTVSRPDFVDIIPRFSYNPNNTPATVTSGNVDLRPQISKNWDAMLSFYSNKLGLITTGVFYKDISDLIIRNTYYLKDSTQAAMINASYDYLGSEYTVARNNDWDASIIGFEADYQANLHHLPKPFNGLLFSTNFTYTNFNTNYYTYYVDKVRQISPLTGRPTLVDVVVDTFYQHNTDNFNINLSLGYQIKGFNINVSYLYKSPEVYSLDHVKDYLSQYNQSYSRVDIKIKQQLTKGLEVFANINNLTGSGDIRYRNIADSDGYFTEREEYYGVNFNIGMRFRY